MSGTRDDELEVIGAALRRAVRRDVARRVRARRRARLVVLAAVVVLGLAGSALAAGVVRTPWRGDGHAVRLGALPAGVEVVTFADGRRTRGPVPKAYAFRSGDPAARRGDIWAAYPPDAVAIDSHAELPARPEYGGGGHIETHRRRDLATGATRTEVIQEQRAHGIVVRTRTVCGPEPRPTCRTRTWTSPI